MASALKKQKTDKNGSFKSSKPSKNITPERKLKVQVEEESSSDAESLDLKETSDIDDGNDAEDLNDLEEDDEVDVANVSSSEDDEESDKESNSDDDSEDDDDEDDVPQLKKKKNIDDGAESFGTAFNAIIGSRLKAYDRKDPILARNKKPLKQFETDKLEAKAKRALLKEKKQDHDKYRVKNLLPSADSEKVREVIEHEKKMKKIAQRGVVRLFNAVLSTQIKTNQAIGVEKVGQSKKEELMNEISKEKFLDLVQEAAQS